MNIEYNKNSSQREKGMYRLYKKAAFFALHPQSVGNFISHHLGNRIFERGTEEELKGLTTFIEMCLKPYDERANLNSLKEFFSTIDTFDSSSYVSETTSSGEGSSNSSL